MAATSRYDILLNGKGYLIDERSYRRGVAAPFVSRQASGQLGYADLALGGAYLLDAFDGGHGQVVADASNPDGYRWGAGVDVHTTPGSARIGYALANLGAASGLQQTGFRSAAVWKGSLWLGNDGAGGDGKIYEWDGTSLTLRRTLTGKGAVTRLQPYLDKLYAANASDGVVESTADGTSWATAFSMTAGANGVYVLVVGPGTGTQDWLYAVAEGVTVSPGSGRPRLHKWDGTSVSSSPLYTLEESQCRAGAVVNGVLYLFGAETSGQARGSLYQYDGSNGLRVAEIPNNVAVGLAGYQGKLYLGMQSRGEIWRWDGTTLEKVHTLLVDQGGVGYTAPVYALTSWDGALWVGRWDSTLLTGLERFDGVSWSLPSYGGPSEATGVRALVAYGDQLVVCVDNASSAHAVQKVGTGYRSSATLETPVQDAGLPDVAKVLRSVDLVHSALASGESIEVQYRLEDTGSWTSLGTSSSVGATAASFTFAAATSGRRFALRFVLAGGGSSTPQLRSAVTRFVTAGAAAGGGVSSASRRWTLEVVLEGTAELPQVLRDGSEDSRSAVDKSGELWAARDGAGPVTFVDVDGRSWSVWFLAYTERIGEMSQRQGLGLRGTVELQEA